jgi:hypothetical protein
MKTEPFCSIDVKIADLTPGSCGHNLVVKVLSVGEPIEKTRGVGEEIRIAEVKIGDDSGCVVFSARNGKNEPFNNRSGMNENRKDLHLVMRRDFT